MAQVNGRLALLVGNGYGDILTLLDDPTSGDFVPDRANLQHAPLAVGTIAATGRQFAVVADQSTDQVALFYRVPGTDSFGQPIPISGTSQLPLLAPGAVQTFAVPGDANPYLAVANSLSNNVLLYHYDPTAGQFALLRSLQVGDDPVSITVAEVTGSQVPDLLVANQGSNDVSVLIGAIDPKGLWTETRYQRLNSGGSGPVAVAVQETGDPSRSGCSSAACGLAEATSLSRKRQTGTGYLSFLITDRSLPEQRVQFLRGYFLPLILQAQDGDGQDLSRHKGVGSDGDLNPLGRAVRHRQLPGLLVAQHMAFAGCVVGGGHFLRPSDREPLGGHLQGVAPGPDHPFRSLIRQRCPGPHLHGRLA